MELKLWDEQELRSIGETLYILRQMRNAATIEKMPFFIGTKIALSNFLFYEKASPKLSIHALDDAENLANLAGDYIGNKLARKNNSKRRNFEEWQDYLSEGRKNYSFFSALTYARTSLDESIVESLLPRFRNLDIDSDYMLKWDLTKNNNLGHDSTDGIINDNLTVVSPLSGDYFALRVNSSFLFSKYGKSFDTLPVAFSKDLSKITFPSNRKEGFMINPINSIALYIDTPETGNTTRALYGALNERFSDHVIYEPVLERVDFSQSKKMQEFWKEYEKKLLKT